MGFDFRKFLAVLSEIAPPILKGVGGEALVPLVPLIVTGIAEAEKLPGASGAEKKATVLELVKKATAGTNIVRPGTIDPALVESAAGHAIDAVITSVKAVQGAQAQLPTAG